MIEHPAKHPPAKDDVVHAGCSDISNKPPPLIQNLPSHKGAWVINTRSLANAACILNDLFIRDNLAFLLLTAT